MADLCRTHGITEQTYYRWKTEDGGMQLSEMQRLKQLEDENRWIVAEQTLDIQALRRWSQKREAHRPTRCGAVAPEHPAHQSAARAPTEWAELPWRYRRHGRVDKALLLARLAGVRGGTGARRLVDSIRWWREGSLANHKRVHRVYRDAGVQVRRRRKRVARVERLPLSRPTSRRDRWSMDCLTDTLADGRRFGR